MSAPTSPSSADTSAAGQAPYAAALARLPGMGPATLVRVLQDRRPEEAWDAVRSGEIERPAAIGKGRPMVAWSTAARFDPPGWWEQYDRAGIHVTWRGHHEYPAVLRDDPEPPGVLFWRGDLSWLDLRRVAIVGTRNATPEGRQVAFEMGRDLADAGVCVISGLALGIDGAAHSGVLQAVALAPAAGQGAGPAGPVGVAASGVDFPYPRRHAQLWERVVEAGAVVSENLPGQPAQAWRFPSRNRVIAGLSDLVVVVESHAKGGSLITAGAAIDRGIEVRVVPGPVRSAASAGSNQLLYDGPGPVRHAQDVLDALGMFRSPQSRSPKGSPLPSLSSPGYLRPDPVLGGPPIGAPSLDPPSLDLPPLGAAPLDPPSLDPPSLDSGQRRVLEELGWTPITPGRVMARTGLDLATTGRALAELRDLGLVGEEGGWWFRRR